MLWLEKYKPRDFNSMTDHTEIISILQKYNIHNIPHLIFHGKSGSGKKLIAYNLIKHLFGQISVPNVRTSEVKAGSRMIEVNFLEANEFIEISPSDYNFQDKIIIQSIIKEMAQSRPVMSFFSTKKTPSIKFVIISAAHDLSHEAQAALRRTIEVYSECFRIILICSQLSKIIEPIRSRCVFVRIRGFKPQEIKNHIKNIVTAENININEQNIEQIIKISDGNMRRALGLLEILYLKHSEEVNKRLKLDLNHVKLEWEVVMDEISALVRRSHKTETIIEVRKKLYVLINSCITAHCILMELYKRFVIKESEITRMKIVDLALIYEERLRQGTKGIYHIEAFIIGCVCVFSKLL